MMQRLFFLACFISLFLKVNSQTISVFRKLADTKQDTIIDLRYFKDVENTLTNRIDSFDLFLKKTKFRLEKDYFYKIKFTSNNDKLEIAIAYQSDYHDYVMLTNSRGFEQVKNKLKVFAFFFYKNRLILCTTYRDNISTTKESSRLLKNLIYEHVGKLEKENILNPPDQIKVQTKPIKGYKLN